METAGAYIPMDRRQELARGRALPERSEGAALFADISGFTPLTETLVAELGSKRGAEELTHHLNEVYGALIAELHRYGGSVISFAGDAITCWLDGDDGSRATACARAMQHVMEPFAHVRTRSGGMVSLAMKAAVATGAVSRFVVGDPACCLVDAMAGRLLDRLAVAESLADRGEVVLTPEAAAALGGRIEVLAWRTKAETLEQFAVLARLTVPVPECPWPPLPPEALSEEQACPWLLPPVYRRLQSGQGEFLAELRPAVALFLRFGGIDYDHDPAASDKLNAVVSGVQHILLRYEGSLLQVAIGDKGSYLYASFGAPIAHEDDAQRAASAALELQRWGERLDFLSGVQIGIAQGRMRTGAYGSPTRRTYGVLGDAVNLSARLMSAAEPGTSLVDDRARTATGEAFVWERLPPIRVKGKSEPVRASRLVGLKEDRSIRLLEPRYALSMVGRQAELATIMQKLELALQGKGQIVGITGEAGMGKSRLTAEAIRRALEQGLIGYGGECQSYGTQTSYLVWHRIWRALFGLEPTASPVEQARTVREWLDSVDPGLVLRLPLLGPALNLRIPDNDLTRSLDAKVRKSSLEALLVDCLRGRARQDALLLVLEDCHWLDPLSHELIEQIGRAIANLPVLLLLVYRPPDIQRLQAPRVSQLPHFTEVELTGFTPGEAEQLIRLKMERALGAGFELPEEVMARIAQRAAGNPFYIEELMNYLHDRGIDPQDAQALAEVDLPSSLTSLVLSRIDQLTESQQTVIKVASVIGRLFPAAMVWGVYPQLGSFERVRADLEELSGLDLTPLDTPEPELSYLFKHIITQEVAYESLLYSTRRVLHEQIGHYIEGRYSDALEQYVNLLAFHYERGENQAKKREYLLKAGEVAQAAYANEPALEYYEKVLPLLSSGGQIPVLLKIGKVLELVGEWRHAGKRYQSALAQAEQEGDRRAQAQCHTEMAELFRKQGQYSTATRWLASAQAVFEELEDLEGCGQVLHYGGTLAAQQGDYEAARDLYQESLEIRKRLDDRSATASLLSNLGIVARFQGDYPLARSLHEEALAIRRELGDRWAIGVSLNNLGNVAVDEGKYSEARALHEEGLAIRREVGDRWAIANALNNLGNLARAQGDYAAAQRLYRESLIINRELGARWAMAYLLEDVGCLAAQNEVPARALVLVGAAARLREEIGAPLSPAEAGKLETALQPARNVLAEEEQETAWAEGRALSLTGAIDLALGA